MGPTLHYQVSTVISSEIWAHSRYSLYVFSCLLASLFLSSACDVKALRAFKNVSWIWCEEADVKNLGLTRVRSVYFLHQHNALSPRPCIAPHPPQSRWGGEILITSSCPGQHSPFPGLCHFLVCCTCSWIPWGNFPLIIDFVCFTLAYENTFW